MGRQNKVNLPYFELDCHMDDKIELIEAEYGLKGFAIVIKLYQRIYGGEHGYYCEFTPDTALLLASHWCGSSGGASGKVGTASGEGSLPGFPKNLITDVVAASIRRDIFSERLFREYGILTSSGIQKQYLKATAKREKVKLKKEYLLISVPENRSNVVMNTISGGRNTISGGRNTQSKSNSNSNSYKDRECVQHFEDFLSAYPKCCNRYLTETAYIDLLLTGKITEDALVQCAINYAEACKANETPDKYIKKAENFLRDMVFDDYMPGRYKKPSTVKNKTNSFHNFEQRDTDYDSIVLERLKGRLGSGSQNGGE